MKFNFCEPPVIWGTLVNYQEYFVSHLKSVIPDIEFRIELAEDGYVVICPDLKIEEIDEFVVALKEMGWNIITDWVREQIHPLAFLVAPENKARSWENEKLRHTTGNPDFWPL